MAFIYFNFKKSADFLARSFVYWNKDMTVNKTLFLISNSLHAKYSTYISLLQ